MFLSSCTSQLQSSIDEAELLTPAAYSKYSAGDIDDSRYQWWKAFSDERLDGYLEQALARNLDMRQGFEQLAQAYAREKDARSSLFPQLTAAFGVERGRRNVSAFSRSFTNIGEASGGSSSGDGGVTTTTYRASVPLRWEIDLWGKLLASSEAAELETRATEERVHSVSLSVAAQTVDTYFQAIELCARLDLLRETIESDEQFYQLIQRRYRSGVSDALEVYQAGQNLAVRRAEQPQFELELRKATSSLALLLGEYPSERELCDITELPREVTNFPVGVPADLLQLRPDVKESFYQLYAADRRLAFAIRDRLPSIIITGSGGYEDLEFKELFRPETLVWRIVAEATQTVFDGGKKSAQVELQQAAVGEKGAAYIATVLDAFRDVEDALSGAELIERRVGLLEARAQSAQRTQSYSMQQYVQGLSNYFPVLDAQRTFYFAQRELLLARRALVSNYVDLARSVGAAWQEERLRERFLRREKTEEEHA